MPPRKIDSEKAKVEKQAKVDTQKKIDFLFVCIQKCVPFKPDWDAVGEIFKISAADAEKQLSDWYVYYPPPFLMSIRNSLLCFCRIKLHTYPMAGERDSG